MHDSDERVRQNQQWLADELSTLALSGGGVLYSLDPSMSVTESGELNAQPGKRYVHLYEILAEVELCREQARQALLAVAASVRAGSDFLLCFDPHHALRFETDQGPVEVFVCFECCALLVQSDFFSGSGQLAHDPAEDVLNRLLGEAAPAPSKRLS